MLTKLNIDNFELVGGDILLLKVLGVCEYFHCFCLSVVVVILQGG